MFNFRHPTDWRKIFNGENFPMLRYVSLYNYYCLTFRWFFEWRFEAVHVVTTVAVVAEQQLVVVLRGPTEVTRLALDALPSVRPHDQRQRLRELHTRRMS